MNKIDYDEKVQFGIAALSWAQFLALISKVESKEISLCYDFLDYCIGVLQGIPLPSLIYISLALNIVSLVFLTVPILAKTKGWSCQFCSLQALSAIKTVGDIGFGFWILSLLVLVYSFSWVYMASVLLSFFAVCFHLKFFQRDSCKQAIDTIV